MSTICPSTNVSLTLTQGYVVGSWSQNWGWRGDWGCFIHPQIFGKMISGWRGERGEWGDFWSGSAEGYWSMLQYRDFRPKKQKVMFKIPNLWVFSPFLLYNQNIFVSPDFKTRSSVTFCNIFVTFCNMLCRLWPREHIHLTFFYFHFFALEFAQILSLFIESLFFSLGPVSTLFHFIFSLFHCIATVTSSETHRKQYHALGPSNQTKTYCTTHSRVHQTL